MESRHLKNAIKIANYVMKALYIIVQPKNIFTIV